MLVEKDTEINRKEPENILVPQSLTVLNNNSSKQKPGPTLLKFGDQKRANVIHVARTITGRDPRMNKMGSRWLT